MYLKIVEISIHDQSKGLYALIEFWPDKTAFDRGDRPEVTNDFTFPNLQSSGSRVVRNADRWPKRLSDGVFIDPETLVPFEPQPKWERESYEVDIPARIKDAAKAYYGRYSKAKLSTKPYPKNHTDPRAVRTTETDPRSLLRLDVTTMAGKGYDLTVVQP